MTSPGTTPEPGPLRRSLARVRQALASWEALLDQVPARRVLRELPWLGGVGTGWWICWRDGGAMVLDGRVTGYQWLDYLNNCWLVENRMTERYDPWRGVVHSGFCGELGESLGSYPNGAILLASICVFVIVFSAGLAGRALSGPWAGMLAAFSISMLPTVSQAARWGNSTPLIAAGTALALASGAAAMRWPRVGWAILAGVAGCLAWATDKRGLLVMPGIAGMVVVAAMVAPRVTASGQGVSRWIRKLAERLPASMKSRLPGPKPLTSPPGWLAAHQRRLLMIPALCLGLLVFPLRTFLVGESTNVEWERHMDAESMRKVHDGTARRWTQQATRTRTWSTWSMTDSNLGRFVPPLSAVLNPSQQGLDHDLMERCSQLSEDEFLVLPEVVWADRGLKVKPGFLGTDCSRATLAFNMRENLSKISAFPLGLVWLALPLCLLPAGRSRSHLAKGLLTGGALLAAAASMWLLMASLNVMPTRYLIQFTVGTALLIPVGVGRLVHTLVPKSLAWGVSGLVCLGLAAWASALDINDRDSVHTWSYNQSFLDRYYNVATSIQSYLGPEDDFLDCSDKGINIWLLPDYTRFGTPMLKVDDAGRCMQWIGWEPEQGTRWLAINPGAKLRPQNDPQAQPFSLESVLRSDANWRLEFDDRGASLQLWKREI